MSPMSASMARFRCLKKRSCSVSTRCFSSSGFTSPWHLVQDASTLRSGLFTWWSVIFSPLYSISGMWQSAQLTPERPWIPWFHISNSGCCALSAGAPVVLWTQSLNFTSS